MDRNSFIQITENPIILDFNGCKSLGEIHSVLKEKFGLPQYYGENWDALWDCLDGLFKNRGDFKAEIYGFLTLDNELRDYCMTMIDVFADVNKFTPNFTFEIKS